MTIVLVAVCTILTILCVNLYFKLTSLKKDLDEYKDTTSTVLTDVINRNAYHNNDIRRLFTDVNNLNETITEPKMQEYANTAVSDALDGVDFDLERYDNAIKAMWQAIGTQKKRLDKIDPVKREPIDPAENLKHQSELMDKMLKQSTDIYAEKLSKVSTPSSTHTLSLEDLPDHSFRQEDFKSNSTKNDSQTPIIGIDLAQGGDFYKDQNGVHKATIVTPARGSGKDLYSKYMEKLNDAKDNFPASKESDTVAFPSDPEIDQYATTQIPTFANNSVEDLDETMDISEFFTRVKNN